MKIFDILILCGMAWFGFQDFRKGFVDSLFSIIALLVGAWCALPFSPIVQKILPPTTETRYLITLMLSFLICITAVFLIGRLFKISLNFVLPDIFDKLLGAAFGVLKVMFCTGILCYCITAVDKDGQLLSEEKKSESILFSPCEKTAEILLPKILDFKEKFRGDVINNKQINKSTNQQQTNQQINNK